MGKPLVEERLVVPAGAVQADVAFEVPKVQVLKVAIGDRDVNSCFNS